MFSVRAATREDLPGIVAVDEAVIGDRHGEEVLAPAIDAGRARGGGGRRDPGLPSLGDFLGHDPALPDYPRPRRAPAAGNRSRPLQRGGRGVRAGGATFWLSSTEETNERSLLFHEALGFRRIGTLGELGQDVGEVFMRKDLG